MSRRHHGRPHHHGPGGPDRFRRNATAAGAGASFAAASPASGSTPAEPAAPSMQRLAEQPLAEGIEPMAPATADESVPTGSLNRNEHGASADAHAAPYTNGHARTNGAGSSAAAHDGSPTNGNGHGNGERTGQCTAPQLRRFIKSRPYVPMHELRRRFAIDGADDDVTPVKLEPGWVYVGLPSREGTLLGDLLRSGEIGYELSLDPRSPIVIGVYPMKPIPRS